MCVCVFVCVGFSCMIVAFAAHRFSSETIVLPWFGRLRAMVPIKVHKAGLDGPLARCIARLGTNQPTAAVVKKEVVGAPNAAGSSAASSGDPGESTASSTATSQAAVKEDDYEDPSPAGTWVKEWVAQNKKDYNGFNYRLGMSDAFEKSEWKRIVKEGTAGEARQFVEHIKASRNRTTRTQSVADIDMNDEDSTWMSWKEASDKEGEQQLRAMVSSGTVQSRRHPCIRLGVAGLPPSEDRSGEEQEADACCDRGHGGRANRRCGIREAVVPAIHSPNFLGCRYNGSRPSCSPEGEG